MHGYYWDRQKLKDKLSAFSDGQFLLIARSGLILRGEIKGWSIPDMNKRRVVLSFKWLCEEHFGKWHPSGSLNLDVEFRFFYFQRKKEGREERVKMWTTFGEVCRFFVKDDPSNLKQQNDEFMPRYKHKHDSGPED